MLKLLIAEGTEEFRLALSDSLTGAYIIRMCQEGNETLEVMHSFKPDIMVLDVMLPGLDGITLLQRAAAAGLRPMVLATTRFQNDYVVEALGRLGVGYVMVKPCDVKATVARLADLTEHLAQPVLAQPDPRTVVSNLLLALGISTKLRGYIYLRDAIQEEMRSPGQMVTKELYPKVGKPYGANKTQVERSIRSAIEKAWDRRNEQLWRLYFQTDADGILHKPSNAVFISCLANRIQNGRETEERQRDLQSAAE